MSEEQLVKVFESPKGINQVDSPKSAGFQPGGEQAPFLAQAENVDLLRTGGLKRRQGRTLLRTLTNGHSLWSGAGMLLYTDNGTLYRYQSDGDEALVSGLHSTAEISFTEAAGQVFWSNGHERGRIQNGTAKSWGAEPINAPSLSATTGNLQTGRYLVAVTPVVDGVEGGCIETAEIELTSTGGISVSAPADPSYEGYHVYLSDTNGDLPFYHSSQTATSFTLTNRASSIDPCNTLGTFPPPPGHLVRYWNGRIIVATSGGWYGNALYFSDPMAYHHFRPDENMQVFPDRVVLLEPSIDGFYVGLENGSTYFVQGDDPRQLKRIQVDDKPVCEGSAIRVPARKLPWLQADLDVLVPIWATADGWAVGLPGGVVRYPVDGRLAIDTNKRATAAYVERPSLRQILLSAREKTLTSRIGAGDQMSLTVTRGGVPL